MEQNLGFTAKDWQREALLANDVVRLDRDKGSQHQLMRQGTRTPRSEFVELRRHFQAAHLSQ